MARIHSLSCDAHIIIFSSLVPVRAFHVHDIFIHLAPFLRLLSGFENADRILLDVTAALVSRQEAVHMIAVPSGVSPMPKFKTTVIQGTKQDWVCFRTGLP